MRDATGPHRIVLFEQNPGHARPDVMESEIFDAADHEAQQQGKRLYRSNRHLRPLRN